MTSHDSTLRSSLRRTLVVALAGSLLTVWLALTSSAFGAQGSNTKYLRSGLTQIEPSTQESKLRELSEASISTAFTYQGQLKDSGGPVSGVYDLQFILRSAQTGEQKLGLVEIKDLNLTNGMFSVQIDFGNAVLGAKESWLEIGVRPSASTDLYRVLAPRQKLRSTPYAIFAQHEQWSLIGVPIGFPGDAEATSGTIGIAERKGPETVGELTASKPAEKSIAPAPADRGTFAAVPAAPCVPAVSCSTNDPAFSVSNTGVGHGIEAHSRGTANNASGVVGVNDAGGWGVSGFTNTGFAGVFGFSGNNGVFGLTSNPAVNAAGIFGQNDHTGTGVFGNSVYGQANPRTAGGIGVFGRTERLDGVGVLGRYDGPDSQSGWGVFGFSPRGFAGVFGSGGGYGIFGQTGNTTAENAAGVYGKNDGVGIGVFGQNRTTRAAAVLGRNDGGGDGVAGYSTAGSGAGVYGFTDRSNGVGGRFTNFAGGVALRIEGLTSTDSLRILRGADLSEQFVVKSVVDSAEDAQAEQVQPGMVVSIDPASAGRLVVSSRTYDRRVAGIISGAGGLKPAMVVSQTGSVADGNLPVALSGRVYCWADASTGSIEPGDLLTTSGIPGHAMKVTNYRKAQGAIIGKAMTPLAKGRGLVLVLITLQ